MHPLLAVICHAVVLAGSPSASDTRPPPRPTSSQYSVQGLERPVEILVDRWGIGHIYASSQEDVFLAQGFNAARDRLWQLDLWRRRGLGQLSEVLGPRFVEQDRAARLFLYRGDMRKEWLAYGEDTERIVSAFVEGINQYIRQVEEDPRLLPMEFELLGYRPARWSPEDVVRIRSHGLSRNVRNELARLRILRGFGEGLEALRSHFEPPHQLTIPEGLDLQLTPDDALKVYELATQAPVLAERTPSAAPQGGSLATLVTELADARSLGSNSWVLSPKRSATRRPILASDPHRMQSIPSLRYIVHLVAPGLDVIGAGEPMIPGISIGHNGRAAFGLTIFGADEEDLYVYETNPANPSEYRYQGEWEPMVVESQEIAIHGSTPVSATLKYTRHGPVIYEDPEKHLALAVRAAWLEPGMAPYLGSLASMRAKSWKQFVGAMRRWGAPAENLTYADVSGTIGLKVGGRIPIRPNWDGLLPVPGDGRYEWSGFHPPEVLPGERNPPRGWIATANEMNLPPGYAHQVGFDSWATPFRFQRIAEVLDRSTKATVADMVRLQNDHLSLMARRLTAMLEGLTSTDEKTARALQLLQGWDCVEGKDSAAALLYEVWIRHYLGATLVTKVTSEQASTAVVLAHFRSVIELLAHPDSRLGEDPLAARNEVLLSSLKLAMERALELQGPDPASWAWGRSHQALIEHPLSPRVDEPTRAVLNAGPRPRGGAHDTVGNTGYGLKGFHQVAGSSFRMVLDVGNWDRSVAMNTPGQSGDPRSPHYKDLFEPWSRDESFPLLYRRPLIEKALAQRISLVPRK